jgi:hypothetical protein
MLGRRNMTQTDEMIRIFSGSVSRQKNEKNEKNTNGKEKASDI